MYTVNISFADENGPPLQLKLVKAGQTLLQILLSNNINIRHDCGGVCYCTTCHVVIENGTAFIEEPSKREIDFLKRVEQRKANSRLACQCLLLKGMGKIDLIIG